MAKTKKERLDEIGSELSELTKGLAERAKTALPIPQEGTVACDKCGGVNWNIIMGGVNGGGHLKAYRCAECGDEFTVPTGH